jgi:hypothetical protein
MSADANSVGVFDSNGFGGIVMFALVDLSPLGTHHVSHATLLLVFDFLIHTRVRCTGCCGLHQEGIR